MHYLLTHNNILFFNLFFFSLIYVEQYYFLVAVSLGSSRSATPAFSSPTGHQSSLSPCVTSSPIASFGLNNSNVFMPISNHEKSEASVCLSHPRKWHQSATQTNFYMQYNNDLQVVKPEPSRITHSQKYSLVENPLSMIASVIRISPVGNAKVISENQLHLEPLKKLSPTEQTSATSSQDRKFLVVRDENSPQNPHASFDSSSLVETEKFSSKSQAPNCTISKDNERTVDKSDHMHSASLNKAYLGTVECVPSNNIPVIRDGTSVTSGKKIFGENCKMQDRDCAAELQMETKKEFQGPQTSNESFNSFTHLNDTSKILSIEENHQVKFSDFINFTFRVYIIQCGKFSHTLLHLFSSHN